MILSGKLLEYWYLLPILTGITTTEYTMPLQVTLIKGESEMSGLLQWMNTLPCRKRISYCTVCTGILF